MTTLDPEPASVTLTLEPADNQRLASLCGQFDEHLRQLENRLDVEIINRGNNFRIEGSDQAPSLAGQVLQDLYAATREAPLTPERVHLHLQEAGLEMLNGAVPDNAQQIVVQARRCLVKARGANQLGYIHNILNEDVNFGIGPAGTGKTYLAVACAVQALEREQVRRLVLVRPAVEAGERLGFLPGDLTQKIDPYLRPLYDALYEMMGFERVAKLIERNVIEIAPLAFMRGRTLNDAFIILDEAQNTTVEQMKMFLTRTGFGSTAVVTGDITQIDLARGIKSGLRHIAEVLKGVEGIGFTWFDARDVVRHPMVKKILYAYDRFEQLNNDD
ncbi:Phosphate starvation-inducible protein PhoH, predicted ATPase [hydrothermal vent metagenome]|uniref:PhoH-like protein n=1 Tax=hydrothermal vent metagenome TaxID=652676 RepID=A0A3B0Y0M2_9ZZZZ